MDAQETAKSVYETICSALDNRNWKYTRNDEKLTLNFGVRGDDLSMDFLLRVNPRVQVISLFSMLPYKISQDKRAEAAMAVAVANYGLINGSFDYDIRDGEVRFRMCSSYRESLISEDLINYMISASVNTVDNYNDRFLMVSKGIWSVEDFQKWEEERHN